jgi:uncharacterized coiled-coil DUF342 family protein
MSEQQSLNGDGTITIKTSSWNRVVRERDEAREELRTAVQERHDFHWQLLDAVRERDEAREERDELRSEINYYRIKHDLLPISWDV